MLIPRVLIFVTHGTRLLLLKGGPAKRLWPNKFNALGGHIEPGEDPLSAARRELHEEAGLDADLRLCGIITVDTGQTPGIGLFVFSGECDREDVRASEEGSLHWVEFDAVKGLPAVDDLGLIVDRIRVHRPGDAPFMARSAYDQQGRQAIEMIK